MSSEPGLVRQRRFGPFFATQALGAFNDNVFKQALIIMITYQGLVLFGMDAGRLVNFAAIVFILPFFLFSATAGQVADRFEKSGLIRKIKAFEIAVMGLATLGFWLDSISFLLGVLFLMGTQSAFFGPIKYSILPQVLETHELVKGNGQVSMGTFVAILLGSLAGGALIAVDDVGWVWVSAMVLAIAVTGYAWSRRIPAVPVSDPELKVDLNIVRQTLKMMGYVRENPVVFRSILGNSWFWFFGSVLLAQLPPLIQAHLRGDESVAVMMFTLFSIGIGGGSLLCDKLSFRRVEIGLVPLGSLGLSVFGIDLYFAAHGLAAVAEPVGIGGFLARDGSVRFVIDVLLLGVSGGFYIVPLLAVIQHRSRPDKRSRVIAGANVLNALLMVLAGGYSIALLSAGLDVTELLLVTAIMNFVVATYIFLLVPEFLLRFASWALVHSIYRVEVSDLEKIPDEGPALLVSNHVSFVDALVIGGLIRRPVRFVMYYKIYNWPILRWIFKTAKAIPIASAREDRELLKDAFDRIQQELEDGQLVCIFPEGAITRDGEVQIFKSGVEQILARTPVNVIPMALNGLWGSYFSRSDGGALKGPWRKLWARIRLSIGEGLPPERATAEALRKRVLELMAVSAHPDDRGPGGKIAGQPP